MPMIRTGRGIVYFSHVPKCAGTAVEGYLIRRFGKRTFAMLDNSYMALTGAQRWSRCSPQHIDATSLGRLFPPAFFDAIFTVVRHPVLRLRSAYLHQRDIEQTMSQAESFSEWLSALPARRSEDPWCLDNHVRPMDEIVPAEAKVFRLEEGTEAIVEWLDEIVGNRNGPRVIERRHSHADRLAALDRKPVGPTPEVSVEAIAQIAEMYTKDFSRFGYPSDPADMVQGFHNLLLSKESDL